MEKVVPRSPTARRQTLGAWESCWMLQSWLPHNLTMPFVGCETELSDAFPVRKATSFFSPWCGQSSPCQSPLILVLTFIVHPSLLSFHLLNHFTVPLFLVFPLRIHPSCGSPCPAWLRSSLHSPPPLLHSLITMSIMPACLMWCRRMVSITCNKGDGA